MEALREEVDWTLRRSEPARTPRMSNSVTERDAGRVMQKAHAQQFGS